ncbi:MAG: GGDEF domain-containing protein [Gammaproteobacteria bacterium]|nr:GGDEF domain-containing protein [Gammaproteobacteria bacterium]
MHRQLANLLRAMELLPDGVLVVDQARLIIGCNERVARMFGYDRDKLIGQPLQVLVPDEVRQHHAGHVASYFSSGTDARMGDRPVLRGRTRQGDLIPISVGLSRVSIGGETFVIAAVRDASAFDETIEDTKILAETDSLTQLGNRRCLQGVLARHDALMRDESVGVLYLDLDGFKPINDRYGHDTGDKVLSVVARRLKRCLREDDTCIRLGGDEFVVIARRITDPAVLESIARKIHESIAAPMHLAGHSISVGVSIGGAIGHGDLQGAHIIEIADSAMYDAKTAGEAYRFGGIVATPTAA